MEETASTCGGQLNKQ